MRLAVDVSVDGPITPDVLDEVAKEAAELFKRDGWGEGWIVDRVGRMPAPRWIEGEEDG